MLAAQLLHHRRRIPSAHVPMSALSVLQGAVPITMAVRFPVTLFASLLIKQQFSHRGTTLPSNTPSALASPMLKCISFKHRTQRISCPPTVPTAAGISMRQQPRQLTSPHRPQG